MNSTKESLEPFERQKRKNILINPKFQIHFLSLTTIGTVAALAVFWIATEYVFRDLKQVGITSGLTPDHPYFGLLDHQAHYLKLILGISSFSSFVILSVFSLILSHRVAGPIERTKDYLELVTKASKPDDLQFREGDYFSDLAQSINQAIKRLK